MVRRQRGRFRLCHCSLGAACCLLSACSGANASDSQAGSAVAVRNENVGSVAQAATIFPRPRVMPENVQAARDERPARADRLVEFWYRDYLRAVDSARAAGDPEPELTGFGNAVDDGGTRTFRRIASVLLRQGAAAAPLVERWTSTLSNSKGGTSYHAGTDCVGDNGDWDMSMKEMISLLYLFKDRRELLTDAAVFNILTKGLSDYLGPTTNKLTFGCVDGHYPETENHVLMIESSRYLANQFIAQNPRGDWNYYAQFGDVANHDVNPGSQVEDLLLQALGRVVWGDMWEFNARTYEGLAAHAILNLYDNAASETVRAAAKNALDFLATKFAFGSFEGKRWSPTRRNHRYANTLNMQEQDSFTLFMAALSGGYVWDDTPQASPSDPLSFYEETWLGEDGKNLTQGVGLGLWAALSQYSIPETAHDFLLNKHDGYWARMHSRHYEGEYTEGSPAKYFSSAKQRWTGSSMVFAPETYFVTPRFMNVAGGQMAGYPLRSAFAVANEVDNYDVLSRPMALLIPGHYGAWPDDVSFGRCGGVPGTSGIYRNTPNMNATLLNMLGDLRFWKSSNYGTYKSFGYGYFYNQTCGATKSAHTQWPMNVPASWASNSYKEGTTDTWSKGRADFRFYDLRNEYGFYVVLGHVSKSMNMTKYRDFARGFWEIVPQERFASVAALKNWTTSDANNPASSFTDTTSGDAKWFKYKMTTGETLWLDILVGYDDGAHNDPILKIVDEGGNAVDLKSQLFSRTDNESPPLLEVYGVDGKYRNTTRYATAAGDGELDVLNPFQHGDLVVDSKNYTAPSRIEQGQSISDAVEQPYLPNQFWIASRTASGFVRRLDGARVDGDALFSEPLSDNQSATIEIGNYISGLKFDWGVSSETNYDRLTILVNGVEWRSISGEQVETDVDIPLSTGPASWKIEFRYSKDYSVSRGSDEGWIDNIRFY